MNLLMTQLHAELMRGLLDLAMTWLFAALWVVPPAGLCAMVWRGPRQEPNRRRHSPSR